jgi:hypothetical protein
MESYEQEFDGKLSGDGESFVWTVDKDTFVKIKNREPDEFDKYPYEKEMYLIFPDDIIIDENGEKIEKKMHFKIIYETLD